MEQFYGDLINASDSYGISENFYLPIDKYNGIGAVDGGLKRTEEQLPKPIEDEDKLLRKLGSPFVEDSSYNNNGYPILDWEK